MKYITLLLMLFAAPAYAQTNGDSTAFELQRLKVNALLAERSAKFGQYDSSLTARTGIFGLQTKKDIKRSNEILRQIAINDNDIFKELKILMDYKDMQTQQIQDNAADNSTRIQLYRQTIKKLTDQYEQIKAAADSSERQLQIRNYLLGLLLLSFLTTIYILRRKYRRPVS